MNKTRLLPVVLIIMMAMTVIAFAGSGAPDRKTRNTIDPLPLEPTIEEPATCMEAPLFIGIIQTVQGKSLLTSGIFGIEGDVVVHLPEDIDTTIKYPEGYLVTLYYDGRIAESDPIQIWATQIEAVEEDRIISIDPIEKDMSYLADPMEMPETNEPVK